MTNDIERIANNHNILLETLPDILLLLREDGSIEYKNENAIPFFKECEDHCRYQLRLETYHWLENARELENVIQRAVLISETNMITSEDISFDMSIETKQAESLSADVLSKFNGSPLKGIVKQIEKEVILHKLMMNQGNVAETAETLVISKVSLYEKMKWHDISNISIR